MTKHTAKEKREALFELWERHSKGALTWESLRNALEKNCHRVAVEIKEKYGKLLSLTQQLYKNCMAFAVVSHY